MINLTQGIVVENLAFEDIARCALSLEQSERKRDLIEVTKASHYRYLRAREICTAIRGCIAPLQVAQELLEVARDAPSTENTLACMFGWFDAAPEGTIRAGHRSAAREIIFDLWCQRKVVLPVGFGLKSTINIGARIGRGSQLLNFISTYKATNEDIIEFGRQVETRVSQDSLSWIYSTSWHDMLSIELVEVMQLMDYLAGLNYSTTVRRLPSSVSLVMSLLSRDGRLSFGRQQLTMLLDERIRRAKAEGIEKRLSNLSSAPYVRGGIRTFGFFSLPEHLGGTQYEFPKDSAECWNKLFGSYLEYRVYQKGFESTREVTKALYVLADYMAFFLPQTCSDLGIELPIIAAPKDFKAYPFVDRAGRPEPEFLTLREFLTARASTSDSIRRYIQTMQAFFDWVSYAYGSVEQSHIAGPSFSNPVDVKFQVPRGKKRNKSNKVPFRAETLPHLLNWLYSVEGFGCKLRGLSFRELRDLKPTIRSRDLRIDTTLFGEAPRYTYMEEEYVLDTIPRLLLVGQADASSGVNLSTLRMIILALETGLRLQSIQWLDRYSWSKLNESGAADRDYFQLFVNTDKTKAEPWKLPILRRVFEMLERQSQDLDRRGVQPRKFPYEGRRHSRFDPVTPLLVNSANGVISDSAYQKYWGEMLFSFTGFSALNGLRLAPMISLKKHPSILGAMDPGKNNKQGLKYCDLHIKKLHTPHSCRTTYITRRSGATNLVILAELVGHSSEIVTAYYDYPERHEIIDALKVGEQIVQNPGAARPQMATIRSGPCYVRARLANSALQKSFSADPGETIRRFRMISLSSALSSADETGLDVLRNSRAADVVFRDTHICPVGEECPQDVIEAAGSTMRCGVCKLSCKSVDHLPAISAKIRALKAAIKHNADLFRSVKKCGDRVDELRVIAANMDSDAYELAGWEQSELILHDMLQEEDYGIHTDQPEVIRDHLRRVVRASGQSQFLADRLMDVDAYPSLITDELRLKVGRLVRMIGSSVEVDDADPDSDIKALVGLIRTRLKALGKECSQAGELFEEGRLFDCDHAGQVAG